MTGPPHPIITPPPPVESVPTYGWQIQAARGALDMTQLELQDLSGVNVRTIRTLESSNPLTRQKSQQVIAIGNALWRKGVKFTPRGVKRILPEDYE